MNLAKPYFIRPLIACKTVGSAVMGCRTQTYATLRISLPSHQWKDYSTRLPTEYGLAPAPSFMPHFYVSLQYDHHSFTSNPQRNCKFLALPLLHSSMPSRLSSNVYTKTTTYNTHVGDEQTFRIDARHKSMINVRRKRDLIDERRYKQANLSQTMLEYPM